MEPISIGFISLAGVFLLLMLGCPVGLAMLIIGVSGFAAIVGLDPALSILETATFDVASNYSFSLIPLFLLMGSLTARAGFSKDLFESATYFSRHWNGGLALAAISGSAAFSAVSGSSLATATTMTRVAYPEMVKQGYHPKLAAGSLAAGGTLGIMIPPSIALMLYALITEQSVGDLFLAGFLPGLLGYALYLITVTIMVRRWAPIKEDKNNQGINLLKALKQLIPMALLFSLIMGGLYSGVFSPTEAAGVGAALALIFSVIKGLSWQDYYEAAIEAVSVTSTIFLILIGAEALGFLISVSQISFEMVSLVERFQLGPWTIIIVIICFYLILGCFLESLAMILLTVPIFYPVVVASGFDPIWFGIIAVVTVETGLISPPVGMNLYVVKSAAKELKMTDIMAGVIPFVIADVVRIIILIAFPAISLWLPSVLGGASY